MMTRVAAAGLLLLTVLASTPAFPQDTDSAMAVYGFTLNETVALRLSASGTERVLDVRDSSDLYLRFGDIQGMTGAITGYDVYASATASANSDGAVRPIDTGGLELRLDDAGFSGTAPTWANAEIFEFQKAVAPPERTLLFTGGNNVADSTRFVVEARVDLEELVSAALHAGDVVTYRVLFTIIER